MGLSVILQVDVITKTSIMILRRFAKALREQDWFTVVLEITIVVIGIFIGLQVDDWNQARKNQSNELVYIERLTSDLQSNLELLEVQLEILEQQLNHSSRVMQFLSSDHPVPQTLSEIRKRGPGFRVLPALRLNMSTYEELLSSGRLTLIRNDNLRVALQSLSAQYAYTMSQLEYFRHALIGMLDGQREFEQDWVTLTFAEHGIQDRDYNYEAVRGDQSYLKFLSWATSTQVGLRNMRHDDANETRRVLQMLKCAVTTEICE